MDAGEEHLLQGGGSKFRPGPQYNDRVWTVAFMLHLAVVMGFAGYFLRNGSMPESSRESIDEEASKTLRFYAVQLAATVATAGLVVTASYVWLMRSSAKYLVWITLVLPTAMSIATMIALLAQGQGIALFPLIIVAINLLYIYYVRNRIPFAVALLETVIDVINTYTAVFAVSALAIAAQLIWSFLWSVTAFNSLEAIQSDEAGMGIAGFGLLISVFWTAEVISNIVLVTVAGVMAEWFFLAPSMKENPTRRSFMRAIGPGFGPICFGSFVIAVVKALRQIAQSSRENKNDFIRCCAECLLRCLEDIIEFVNLYAFTYVAIYGMGYCDAAKSVWTLLKHRGWDIIVNDDLIGGVLLWGCVAGAVFTSGISTGIAYAAMGIEHDATLGIIAGLGFLVGLLMSVCVLTVVQGCVVSLLVCYCEDPAALSSTKPVAYDKLTDAFHARYSDRVRMFQQA